MSDDEDASYGGGWGGGFGGGESRGGPSSGRARRKNAKYYNTNYEQDVDLEDSEDEGEEEEPPMRMPVGMMEARRVIPQALPRNRGRPKKAMKKCPGCDEQVKASSTTCEVCDYVFTSAKAQAMEEVPVADRFSFEPEYEEDGSMRVEMILARRKSRARGGTALLHGTHQHGSSHPGIEKSKSLISPTATSSMRTHALPGGRKVVHSSSHYADPNKEKLAYEYLVKFKNASYLHTKWLTYFQIEALGQRSKAALNRWLKKREQTGVADVGEDELTTFDNSYCVVEKLLDMREEELEETEDEEEEEEEGQPEGGGDGMATGGSFDAANRARQPGVGGSMGGEAPAPNPRAYRQIDPFMHVERGSKGWLPMVRCRFVYNKVVEDEYSDWFYEPVDTNEYSDYLQIVAQPMSLSEIRMELEKPTPYGNRPAEFLAQMQLIFNNCREYNGPLSGVYQAAEMFARMIDRLYAAWVTEFERAQVGFDAPLARPWELTCRVCDRADQEDQLLMCDHCDAEYHMSCITPPITEVPAGPYYCSRCELIDNVENQSHMSEEAYREKVDKALRLRHPVVKRLYLVKWKDLGYKDCTWEKPEDFKDDAKIEEYHKLNDSPPMEPTVTQEDLDTQLAKSSYPYEPAVKEGDDFHELEFQIYAQMRAAHFLRWDMAPPAMLLKDCGPLSTAYTLTQCPESVSAVVKHTEESMEAVRGHVALYLSELIGYIARGTLHPAPGLEQREGEYDVTIYREKGESLFLNIGNWQERVVVMGFRAREDGVPGSLQRSGKVRENDILIGINGQVVSDIPFKEVIDLLQKAAGFMTLRFVKGTYREVYLDRGSRNRFVAPPKEVPIATVPRAPAVDAPIPQPVLSNAIFRVSTTASGAEWGARIWYQNKMHELGRFQGKKEAAEAFRNAMQKLYGQEGVQKYCGGLQYFVSSPYDAVNTAAEDVMSEDSDDEGYEDPSSGLDKSSWLLMGENVKLMRSIVNGEAAPHPLDWFDPLYFNVGAPPYNDLTDEKANWVEQLDMSSGASVRLYPSVLLASQVTGVPVAWIQQAMANAKKDGAVAGGFRWKRADQSSVAANIKLWKTKASHIQKVEGFSSDEPWRRKLPSKTKVFKDGNKLRDYQHEGVSWLLKCWYTRRSCILADEMGLGKTVQIVVMLEHIFSTDGLPGPFLVVVPLSTIEHWRREIESWTEMRYCMYYDVGGGRGMRDVMREYEWFYRNRSRRVLKMNVLVTTYEALVKDYEEIGQIPWRVIVVDEAHRLRNWKGKLHECLKSVSQEGIMQYGYQHRVLMTGTPLQNNTQELWSLLNFIEPNKFPDLEKFNERYGRISDQDQVYNLQRRLEPHLLRRTKEDVASDIPPKEETIIDVELTTLQKQYYRAIFERNHSFLNKGGQKVLPKLMNIQMELRKCCNHPFLIDGVEETFMEGVDDDCRDRPWDLDRERLEKGLVASSGKMVLIDKLLPKLKREDHKVLIFSQMIRVLDLLEELCEKRGFSVERLDGRITGNQRQQAIDRFNKEANSFVFLLSTRAGGVGINLTAADTVIIFDSDWNPQNDIQAQARCHRIGQTKEVQVYRLITRRSFESEMFDRASKKLGLEVAVLGGDVFRKDRTNEGDEMEENIDRPSKAEMENLLKKGAYALMEDDEAAKEFCEEDIDKIMSERTHRIVVEAPGKTAGWLSKKGGLKKKTFTAQGAAKAADVDVDDPDFWLKVMPDLKTPEMMERKYENLDTEDPESVRDFYNELASMIESLQELKRKDKIPPREKDATVSLLLRLTMNKGDMFLDDELATIRKWHTEFEGSRVRSCRNEDRLEGLEEIIPRRRGRKSGGEGAKGTPRSKAKRPVVEDNNSDVCVLCADGGNLLMCDGSCKRSFHLACLNLTKVPKGARWICPDCNTNTHMCLLCNEVGEANKSVLKCKRNSCGRYYHLACLEKDGRVSWPDNNPGGKSFLCPQHSCRVCKEPAPPVRNWKNVDDSKVFLQCIYCPNASHKLCLDTESTLTRILTNKSMVCEAHYRDVDGSMQLTPNVSKKKMEEGIFRKVKRKKGADSEDDFFDMADDYDEDGMSFSDDDSSGGGKSKGRGRPRKPGTPKKRGLDDANKRRRRTFQRDYVSQIVGPFRGPGFKLVFSVESPADKGDEEAICPTCRLSGKNEAQIRCDMCCGWYHMVCVGLDKKKKVNKRDYKCASCKDVENAARTAGKTLEEIGFRRIGRKVEEEEYEPIIRVMFDRQVVSESDFNTPSKAKVPGEASKDGDDSEGGGTRMGQGGDSDDDPVMPLKKAKLPQAFGGVGGAMAPPAGGFKGDDDDDEDDDDDGSDEEDDHSNPSNMGGRGSSFVLGAKGWGERPPSSQGGASAPQQVLPTADDGGEMQL